MQTNPTHSGKIEIDLELIATGNTYRIFENQGNKLSNLTQAEDNSWRLYFEPESNQIELQDMQKVVFNTFSDVQWTISPPSLKSFIKDFQNVAAGKSDDEKLVNFILHWEFQRDFPVGKERTAGVNKVSLTKQDIVPVEAILEKDNKIDTPSSTRDGADKGKTSLAQLLRDNGYDDSTLLQTGSEMYFPN